MSAASGRVRCVGVDEGVGIASGVRAVVSCGVAGWRENLRRLSSREGVDRSCPGRSGDGRQVRPGLGGGREGEFTLGFLPGVPSVLRQCAVAV